MHAWMRVHPVVYLVLLHLLGARVLIRPSGGDAGSAWERKVRASAPAPAKAPPATPALSQSGALSHTAAGGAQLIESTSSVKSRVPGEGEGWG